MFYVAPPIGVGWFDARALSREGETLAGLELVNLGGYVLTRVFIEANWSSSVRVIYLRAAVETSSPPS